MSRTAPRLRPWGEPYRGALGRSVGMKAMVMSWRPGNDNGDPVARVDQVHDRVHAVQQAATISVERIISENPRRAET